MAEISVKDIHALIQRALELQNDLMKAGLYKSFHAMNETTNTLGWEAAEILENKHPTKLKAEGENEKKN